jgi:hypothetical protein
LNTHTARTHVATKIATAGSSRAQPPASTTGPGAVGSTTHLRASSSSVASGLSMITSRSVPGTFSSG